MPAGGHELEVAGPVVVAVAVEVVDVLGAAERAREEDLHHDAMEGAGAAVAGDAEVAVAAGPTPRA